MKIFTTKKGLSSFLDDQKLSGKRVGYVATMGALHDGHISLIKLSKERSDITVCSIFVNPTQFNDPKDLDRYPRPVEQDIEKLKRAGNDVLFLPEVNEMYGENESWHIDLGNLENVLEGKFRPGHFQGVTQVVKKFFDIIKPDVAFFGQKDFQQFRVIAKMVTLLKLPVELVMCPIMRDSDGLALSSRNIHLSKTEREQALSLSAALYQAKDNFETKTFGELKKDVEDFLNNRPGIKPEYFELADAETLNPADESSKGVVALVAAYVGKTRLIDNLILK